MQVLNAYPEDSVLIESGSTHQLLVCGGAGGAAPAGWCVLLMVGTLCTRLTVLVCLLLWGRLLRISPFLASFLGSSAAGHHCLCPFGGSDVGGCLEEIHAGVASNHGGPQAVTTQQVLVESHVLVGLSSTCAYSGKFANHSVTANISICVLIVSVWHK